MLYTADGRPRVSIFYTAHSRDRNDSLFTALLLNQTMAWMTVNGAATAFAALYVDELYGCMPTVAEPPTKKPLLTLLNRRTTMASDSCWRRRSG